MTDIDWNTATHAGLVSIGSHALYLSTSGPRRKSASEPAVIIEAGLGSSSHEWVVAQRHIAQFARVYSYDRAGLGYSEKSPEPLTAENRAKELSRLLQAAKVEPPFVMVGHSYGGILVREFLALVGAGDKGVVGMVLVDTNQEKPVLENELFGCVEAILGDDGEYEVVVGLKANTVLSAEEWDQMKLMEKKGDEAAKEEEKHCISSRAALGDKRQLDTQVLGNRRLSVIKGSIFDDFTKLVAWGDGHDRPKEATDPLRKVLEVWEERDYERQREQLKLSSHARFKVATGTGKTHNLQVTQPELIASEVKWVLAAE